MNFEFSGSDLTRPVVMTTDAINSSIQNFTIVQIRILPSADQNGKPYIISQLPAPADSDYSSFDSQNALKSLLSTFMKVSTTKSALRQSAFDSRLTLKKIDISNNTSITLTVPTFISASLSSTNTVLTIVMSEDITGFSGLSDLRTQIATMIKRDGEPLPDDSFSNLDASDLIAFSRNIVTITFATAITTNTTMRVQADTFQNSGGIGNEQFEFVFNVN